MSNNSPTGHEPADYLFKQLEHLIGAVLDAKIAPKLTIEKALWDTQEVASYLHLSYRYTSEYMVTHHTFPEPIRLPTRNQTQGHPRWYAGEVMQWASTFQEH